MLTYADILFYFIFLGQVILISFFFAKRILSRMKYMVETYPPSKYPKLYPVSIDVVEKRQRIFRNMNIIILIAGFMLVLIGVLSGYSPNDNSDGVLLTIYFIVQFSPLMLLEISGFKYFKLMRKATSRTTRKAELSPRRLFDFVSPTLFGFAIFMYAAFIFFVLYIHQFEFNWGSKAFMNTMILTAGNLLFAGIIMWNLYGKKLDPHQAYKDRLIQIELVVKSLVLISIVATMFLAIIVVFDKFDSDHLMPIIMSLYCQLLAVISFQTATPVLQIDNTDFEVYKEEPLVT